MRARARCVASRGDETRELGRGRLGVDFVRGHDDDGAVSLGLGLDLGDSVRRDVVPVHGALARGERERGIFIVVVAPTERGGSTEHEGRHADPHRRQARAVDVAGDGECDDTDAGGYGHGFREKVKIGASLKHAIADEDGRVERL